MSQSKSLSLSVRCPQLTAQPRLLNRAGAWAVANWTLDAASLWVFVAAFGHRVAPDGLLVGYGLANVLAAIPLTPGGLGVVEGVLTPTLVGFGTPSAVALLGVVSWRMVNFWLPIPVGATCYLSLRMGGRGAADRPAVELAEATALARDEAETLPQWAARTGVRLPGRRSRPATSTGDPPTDAD